MLKEKKIKQVIRKIVREAKTDWTTGLYVSAMGDNETLNLNSDGLPSFLERDVINAILSCDETILRLVRITDSKTLGQIVFVFDYDSEASEIVCDYTDNEYTNRLIQRGFA